VRDQQVGEDARRLPEDEEQVHVVGEHEAVHRPGEGEQDAGEAGDAGVARAEVGGAVDEDEGAHAGHDEGEQERERVDPERQGEPELRHPRDRLRHGAAAEHDRQRGERVHEGCGGDGRGDEEDAAARDSREDRQHQG